MIQRYVSKVSGPLLDGIDIHIEVPAVKYKELRAPFSAEDSASVGQRVIAARDRQLERFKSEKKTYAIAQMMPKMIRKHCAISPEGEKLLENAITRLGLSARAHDRILKVTRTIADLDGGAHIERATSSQRGDSVLNTGALLLGLRHNSACELRLECDVSRFRPPIGRLTVPAGCGFLFAPISILIK